jgi:hypothetical protein
VEVASPAVGLVVAEDLAGYLVLGGFAEARRELGAGVFERLDGAAGSAVVLAHQQHEPLVVLDRA